MIVFTRLNHNLVALNPDLIERVEANPDTVITMADDKRVLVLESLDDVVRLITDYRAYVLKRSRDLEVTGGPRPSLHLVPSEVMAGDQGTVDRLNSGAEVETLAPDTPRNPPSTTPRSSRR